MARPVSPRTKRLSMVAPLFFALCASCASGSRGPIVSAEHRFDDADWGPPFVPQSPVAKAHPLVGTIWLRGAPSNAAAVVRAALAVDHVWLGEKHDNPDHHALQARVIEALTRGGACPEVVIEMIEDEKQRLVDEAFRAHAEPSSLRVLLSWDESGWPPFAEYQPIFESAFRHRLRLIAGNLTKKKVHALAFQGIESLPKEERARLGLEAPFPPVLEEGLLSELEASHCGHMKKDSLGPMVLAQRARDGALAFHTAEGRAVEKGAAPRACHDPTTVAILGNGHARRDRGAPYVFSRMAPQKTQLAIAFLEVDDEKRELEAYDLARQFDVVWFTPRANDDDPCAAFHQTPLPR